MTSTMKYTDIFDPIDFLNLLKRHKRTIKKFGLTPNSKLLGFGSYGNVYHVTPTVVVKVTTSYSEAMIAKQLVGKEVSNVVKIYGVMKLRGEGVWLIKMEKLQKFDFKPLENKLGYHGLRFYRYYLHNDTIKDKIIKDMVTGYRNLKKLGIDHRDIHPENVMKNRNNQYKLIDIMGYR